MTRIQFYLVIFYLFITTSISTQAQPGNWDAVTKAAGLVSDGPSNSLTSSEKDLDWQLLFDGFNFSYPWRGYKQNAIPVGWTVYENSIHRASGGGDIIYEQEYSNFVLSMEWKVSKGGNSGIFYRGDESTPKMYMNALEMQVLDNDNYPGDQEGNRTAGAAYDLFEPTMDGISGYDATFKENKEPRGFNHVLIIVHGNHHEYWLNGFKVVSFEVGSQDWTAQKFISKFNNYSSFGSQSSGYIGLQDHTGPIWFRNIKIRPLPNNPEEKDIWPNGYLPTLVIPVSNQNFNPSLEEQFFYNLLGKKIDLKLIQQQHHGTSSSVDNPIHFLFQMGQ